MFEQSFEEWYKTRKSMSLETARQVWSAEGVKRWEVIKLSPHWHGGVPCSKEPTCKSFSGKVDQQTFED
jgi:hypothetical protein